VVKPISQNIAQGLFRLLFGEEFDPWIIGVIFLRQIQGREGPLRQFVMADPYRSGIRYGPVKGRTDKADFNEVVEVSGLQGGILAVVGEAQKFPRLEVEGGLVWQSRHNRGG